MEWQVGRFFIEDIESVVYTCTCTSTSHVRTEEAFTFRFKWYASNVGIDYVKIYWKLTVEYGTSN